jgi:hypothetical protein
VAKDGLKNGREEKRYARLRVGAMIAAVPEPPRLMRKKERSGLVCVVIN